jgi:transposase
LEKGGLSAKLSATGCTESAGLYWGDEMRVGLIGQVRRVWAPRGVKVVQVVAYQRVWAYLNLAVNGVTGQVRWGWTANMKGVSIAPVVKQWGEAGVSVIVWDRARGHRGPAYADVPVQLIEQPPYSPELNPAERVFEYLRGKVEGREYDTMDAKKDAIEAELEMLAAAPERLKSLAGWDWIRESVNSLSLPNTVFQ